MMHVLILQIAGKTQPQAGGSMPNANSSPFLAPTDGKQSVSLLEKFLEMRSILEKDVDFFQLLQTQIQHNAQDADAERREDVRVKVEDLNNDYCGGYSVH